MTGAAVGLGSAARSTLVVVVVVVVVESNLVTSGYFGPEK